MLGMLFCCDVDNAEDEVHLMEVLSFSGGWVEKSLFHSDKKWW